jgi:Domain of unknown function (DUF4160)
VPTIAIIDGVTIMMYGNDHPPAHFHALHAEYRAVIEIDTMTLTRGSLPRPKRRLILDWAAARRNALLIAWNNAQAGLPPGRIE